MNLKNILIKEIKFEQSEGGFACGPVDGDLHVQIQFVDGDGSTHYLVLNEFESFCEFNLTSADYFDKFVSHCDDNDDEMQKLIDLTHINSFGSIELEGEYGPLFERIYEGHFENTEEGKLIRYIVLLMRCQYADLEKYTNLGENKYIKDIDIPLSDDEAEYLEIK